MTTMGKWALVAAAAAALAVGRDASAACTQRLGMQTFQNQKPPYVYAYILPGNDANVTQPAIRGRFWALGDRASANEGTYSDDTWIYPSANGLSINARLDAAGVVGCPASGAQMIAVVETPTLSGTGTKFVVLTADETRLLPARWDFTRITRQFAMQEIPAPQPLDAVTFNAATSKWTVDIAIAATTQAIFGPGVSTALAGYQVVAAPTDAGRDPAGWTPTTFVPSLGALVPNVTVEIPCPPGGGPVSIAVQPKFDSGVMSDLVGASVSVACPAP